MVPLEYYAGNYRQEDPERPCLGRDVAVDGVNALPFAWVHQGMARLAESLRGDLVELELAWPSIGTEARLDQLATLIAAAVGHFIRVHPFLNGNGRMSRVLWTVLLARFGLPHHFAIIDHPKVPSYDWAMANAMRGDDTATYLAVLRALTSAGP